MAATPWRISAYTLGVVLPLWVWLLVIMLFSIRWTSVERPGPPPRQLFPYGEMRIGVDASNPPFAVDNGIEMYGLDIDLGYALAEYIGIPVRFVNMGFDGVYDALLADQVDLIISQLTIDPLRTADVRYTRPYYNAGLVLVSNADMALESMHDLAGRSLAYEFGAQADSEARLWLRRIQPFTTQPYELPRYALDAVRLGVATAALVDHTSARLYLREHTDWAAVMTPITVTPYVIATRFDRWHTFLAVHEGLQALEEAGILEHIVNKWL